MPHCIKESEYDPSIHVKISGPHTLAECAEACGSLSSGFMKQNEKGECGCLGDKPHDKP